MRKIEYLHFSKVALPDLIEVLNSQVLRTHLVEHPLFEFDNGQAFIRDKIALDNTPRARVRVVVDGNIAGWCGLQPDNPLFELAIVLDKAFWGCGMTIFKTLMSWAEELGHEEVVFHLLETRPVYIALSRKAKKVFQTEKMGRRFTTYCFGVHEQ